MNPLYLGVALNEVFVPILKKQFPEIVDFYLPPEGCSYRMAVVTMRKEYPGHAKRIMLGVWSFLRQFMYTKFVIVTDDDVNARDWNDVIWAMTTRMDPKRDSVFIENTPIDYLDFASPVAGLGSKVGFDATNKWQGETDREWGRVITMSDDIKNRVDNRWQELGIFSRGIVKMDNNASEQTFEVTDIHPAGSDVYRIILKPQSGFVPAYQAGQYLEIVLPNKQPCALFHCFRAVKPAGST